MDAHERLLPRKSRFGNHQLFFVVDPEFSESVSRVRWSKTSGGYLESFCPDQKTRIWLHRFVWQLRFGWCPKILDHINGIKWDCRIANLRPATSSLNARNKRVRRKHALPVGVGVRCGKRAFSPKPFYARIRIDGRLVTLGYFATPAEASQAYRIACEKVSLEESLEAERICIDV